MSKEDGIKPKIRASVAMAVYNGERYIDEQIESILQMMDANDELIISYDTSNDNTLNIIREYEANDSRVKVIFDKGHSVESNFNTAVMHCNGKYIFLSDQDDVWINDKINVMCKYFKSHPDVKILISDGYMSDEKLNTISTIFEQIKPHKSGVRNFIKGSYLGCQMAFDSSIKKLIWPVKVTPPLPHDLWLGVLGSYYGKVEIIDDKLIRHRLHGDNYTESSKMKFVPMIQERLLFLNELIKRINRNKRLRA